MNILHVIPIKGWGGGEQVVYSLCKHMSKYGYVSHVLVDPEASKQQQDRLSEVAIVHRIKFRNFGHIYNFFRVLNLIKCYNIKIVNAHGSKVMYLLSMLKAFDADFKLVFFKHVLLKAKNVNMLTKLAYQYIDRVICVSSAVYKEQVEVFTDINRDKFLQINNGIDTEKFNKAIVKEDIFTIGFVGRISSEKGIIFFLEALEELSKRGYCFRTIIVGAANTKSELEYEQDVNKMLAQLDLEIERYGFQEDLSGIYSRLDLLVLPSTGKEAFGLVLCEAMYFGIPVITTNTGGQTDIVIDGENGLVVEPGNVETLVAAMITMINDGLLRKKFAENAVNRVMECFTIDVYSNKINSAYKELLKE